MSDLLVALGLVLVIEGSLYALFPETMKRAIVTLVQSPADALRMGGAASVVAGVALVWLMRG